MARSRRLDRSQPGAISILIELVLGVLIIGGFSWLAINQKYNIYDWFKLRNYHAPSSIASLADQDGLTAYGRKLFYVNHPLIDSKTAFSSVCPNGTEQTVVLGCYHSNEAGIYLLSVTDAQLNGIEQVTAAHETLHAIYDQLSSSERSYVDTLLTNYYNNGLSDPTIKTQIASYKQTEPNAIVDEMHSIFGTEAANLPPALEAYYTKYFTNRMIVVNDYQAYQLAFTSRQAQITSDDQQLAGINQQITNNNAELSNQQSQIQAQRATLESEKSGGQIAQYNQGVAGFNQLVDQYNSLVVTVQNLVNSYNQLVVSRNSIVLEEQQLVQAISSSKQTITK